MSAGDWNQPLALVLLESWGRSRGLRAFLWGATIPADRIEEAVAALRSDTEQRITDAGDSSQR
jgi:hypothetical protein